MHESTCACSNVLIVTNISKDYVKTALSKDKLQLLMSETNSQKLFAAFFTLYDHHDAKSIFFWAVKYLVFANTVKQSIMSRDSYWIKNVLLSRERFFILIWRTVYFVNLTVKMKLHLNNPRAKHSDRTFLLHYYDVFSLILKYFTIKSQHFRLRPKRSKTIKESHSEIVKKFDILNDEIELNSSKTDFDVNDSS